KFDPSRRQFLITIGSTVVALGVGYELGYLTKPAEVITKTVTETTPPISELSPVAQRAVLGAKKLIDDGVVPRGTTIRILHVSGSKAQLDKAIELWNRYVPEINVELVTQGTEPDVYTKSMNEAVTKTGAYDIITIFSTWLGDTVEAGLAKDITSYFNKYDPGYTGACAPIEPLGSYTTLYKGKRYALTLDSDVFTLTYRKDLLNNPTYKD
ncbi:MAG: hypothetical protein QXW58_06915, partial [Thermosphaera sp.]